MRKRFARWWKRIYWWLSLDEFESLDTDFIIELSLKVCTTNKVYMFQISEELTVRRKNSTDLARVNMVMMHSLSKFYHRLAELTE